MVILRLCAGGEIQEPLNILALEQQKSEPSPQWRFQAWGGRHKGSLASRGKGRAQRTRDRCR